MLNDNYNTESAQFATKHFKNMATYVIMDNIVAGRS